MRGWMFSAGLATAVLGLAVAMTGRPQGASDEGAAAAADACFRYGRLECCMRPDEAP